MNERKKKQTEEAMTTYNGNEDGDSQPGLEYRTTWKEVKTKTKADEAYCP